MPKLRTTISETTRQRIEELSELYGYDGLHKRGAFIDFAIASLYRESCLDTSTMGNKKRAARILTAMGKWVRPVSWRSVDKVVSGEPTLIYLKDIGEPYRISSEDWDRG